MFAVLVILCPPLAVLFTAGPSDAAKNVGWTLLLYVPGVIHAWGAVERYSVNRRYEALMRVLDDHDLPPEPLGPRSTRPRAA